MWNLHLQSCRRRSPLFREVRCCRYRFQWIIVLSRWFVLRTASRSSTWWIRSRNWGIVECRHICVKVSVRSKESIIPNGVCWLHSKREMKNKMVFSPILVVATTKTLSFYDVSLKGASLVDTRIGPDVDQISEVVRKRLVVQLAEPAGGGGGVRHWSTVHLHGEGDGRPGTLSFLFVPRNCNR